jgi:N-acetylmuramoyl-L-alanine amidase
LLFSYTNIKVKAIEDKNIVYLDPGHGGMDGGCNFQELIEKDINLKIALKVREILEEKGYEVKMTRSVDKHLCVDKFSKKEDLETRINLINSSDADLYVSIHTNSFVNPKYYGAQVFYNNKLENNVFIAKTIQSYLVENTKTTRIAKALNNIMVLREITKPGCLIECGFISNPDEYLLFQKDGYIRKIANSIVYGIDDYFIAI